VVLGSLSLNFILVKSDFTSWNLLSSNFHNYVYFKELVSGANFDAASLTSNFPFIGSTSTTYSGVEIPSDIISVMYNDSTTDIRKFLLHELGNYTSQGLISDSLNYSFVSNFSNLTYTTISIALLLLLALLVSLLKKKEIIII